MCKYWSILRCGQQTKTLNKPTN